MKARSEAGVERESEKAVHLVEMQKPFGSSVRRSGGVWSKDRRLRRGPSESADSSSLFRPLAIVRGSGRSCERVRERRNAKPQRSMKECCVGGGASRSEAGATRRESSTFAVSQGSSELLGLLRSSTGAAIRMAKLGGARRAGSGPVDERRRDADRGDSRGSCRPRRHLIAPRLNPALLAVSRPTGTHKGPKEAVSQRGRRAEAVAA